MGMIPNVCWRQEAGLAPATEEGPMLRYSMPHGYLTLCSNYSILVPWLPDPWFQDYEDYFLYTTADVDKCRRTGCNNVAASFYTADTSYISQLLVAARWGGQVYEGVPTKYLSAKPNGTTGYHRSVWSVTVKGMDEHYDQYFTPGATDWPTDMGHPNQRKEFGPPNGWAGYPAKIRIHYTPYSAAERALYNMPPDPVTFQVAVYNMRGDLIGASGSHIESGQEIELVYPETDHGGGVLITWDLGTIKTIGYGVKSVDMFELWVPGNANGSDTWVTEIIAETPDGQPVSLRFETSGGGISCVNQNSGGGTALVVFIQPEESPLA